MPSTIVKSSKVNSTSWELEPSLSKAKEERFSTDDMINAYLKGKEAQKNENEKIRMEKFSNNIELAQSISEEFFRMLDNKGIKCKFVTLRPKSIFDFDSIFLVSESDFVSPDFEEIYTLAREKCSSVNSDTFNLSFSFIPYSKNVNKNRLLSDGYVLTYGE